MRNHSTTTILVTITMALSLAACQTTPNVPTLIAVDETPGSSPTSSTTLTMLTAQTEQPGEALPLINTNAEWVAFQDGNGPWKVLEGSGGTYPFEVTNKAGKYGIAYVCPKPTGTPQFAPNPPETAPPLEMRLLTLTDLKAPRFGCNIPFQNPNQVSPTAKTVRFSGAIKGLEATEYATFQTQSGSAFSNTVTVGDSFFQTLPQGTYNVVLGKRNKSASGVADFSKPYTKVIVERDLNLNADTVRDFDFATQGFVPAAKSLSFNGLQKEEQIYVGGGTFYGTATVGLSNFANFPFNASSGTMDVIPENLIGPDDAYWVRAYTSGQQGRDRIGRDVYKTGKTWTSSFNLPPVLAAQFKAEAKTPYARPNLRFEQTVSSGDFVQIRLNEDTYASTGQTTGQHVWNVIATGAWFNTGQNFIAPDFSGLTNWKSKLGFEKITDLGWSVGITQSNMPTLFTLFTGDGVASRELTMTTQSNLFKTLNFSNSSLLHPTADKVRPEITDIVPYTDPVPSTPTDSTNVSIDPGPQVVVIPKGFRVYFSESMDTTSVIAAYQSNVLPANAVTLAWVSGAGQYQQLQITPNVALEKGKTYSFTVGTGAKDLAGNSITAAKTYTYTVPQ